MTASATPENYTTLTDVTISRDGKLYFVDINGYSFGTLLAPDRLAMCYLQTAPAERVASCTELTKQP
jgi:hypothetical protein